MPWTKNPNLPHAKDAKGAKSNLILWATRVLGGLTRWVEHGCLHPGFPLRPSRPLREAFLN